MLGVFSKAIYLAVGDALITIASPDAGNVPYGMLVSGEKAGTLARLQPEMAAVVRPGRITFPDVRLAVDFSRANRWSAELTVPAGAGWIPPTNLAKLRSALRRGRSGAEGLASIGDHLLRLPDTRGPGRLNLCCRTAVPVLFRATDLWKRGHLAEWPSEMQKLLGLGPGLTPSGDDFMIGTLGVLWLASTVDRRDSAAFRKLAGDMGRWDHDATTPFGAFFVRQASLGRFPEGLQDLLVSLVSEDAQAPPRAARQLFGLGATSGRDMAAGVAFGAYLIPQRDGPAPWSRRA